MTLEQIEQFAMAAGERLIAQTQHARELETQLRENGERLRALEAEVKSQDTSWRQRLAHWIARVQPQGRA